LSPRPPAPAEQFGLCSQSLQENSQKGLKPGTTASYDIIIIIIIIVVVVVEILKGLLPRPLHNTFK
jgi:hypothetical protein